jgi:hypothetical protein
MIWLIARINFCNLSWNPAKVELAGLEPATSWVRFMSGWGLQGTRRDG